MIGVEQPPLRPSGPAVLNDITRDVVCSFPDVALVQWAASSDIARDVLSPREIAHVGTLLSGDEPDIHAAARYIRQQLRTGDHVTIRARIELTPGAVLTLGGRRYTVVCRRGRLTELRGERGGRADLCPPVIDGGRWSLYRGGLGRPNAKTELYRRDDSDGTFTAAPRRGPQLPRIDR